MDIDETIQPMAAAIYEVDAYHGIEDWSALCETARHEGYAFHNIACEAKIACIEKAKAALAALQETMPDTSCPASHNHTDHLVLGARFWNQLKNLGT